MIPPDIARVLDTFQKLGDAARRGLHVAERQTRHAVQTAVQHAQRLRQRGPGQNR